MRAISLFISLLTIILFGSAALAQEMVPIRGHTPDRESLQNSLLGATAMQASRSLELQITLKVQHKGEFDKLPDEQNDPNSTYYHHQFSREEIARDFDNREWPIS
jgi:hypothetical protein